MPAKVSWKSHHNDILWNNQPLYTPRGLCGDENVNRFNGTKGVTSPYFLDPWRSWLAQLTHNQLVVGSSPTGSTKTFNEMARAILKYDLTDVDDRMSHMRALKSLDMMLTLWDLDQELRSLTKYASDDMPTEEYEAYIKVREMLHQKMNEYNLDFDNLLEWKDSTT